SKEPFSAAEEEDGETGVVVLKVGREPPDECGGRHQGEDKSQCALPESKRARRFAGPGGKLAGIGVGSIIIAEHGDLFAQVKKGRKLLHGFVAGGERFGARRISGSGFEPGGEAVLTAASAGRGE